jgi:hypothetical protein
MRYTLSSVEIFKVHLSLLIKKTGPSLNKPSNSCNVRNVTSMIGDVVTTSEPQNEITPRGRLHTHTVAGLLRGFYICDRYSTNKCKRDNPHLSRLSPPQALAAIASNGCMVAPHAIHTAPSRRHVVDARTCSLQAQTNCTLPPIEGVRHVARRLFLVCPSIRALTSHSCIPLIVVFMSGGVCHCGDGHGSKNCND